MALFGEKETTCETTKCTQSDINIGDESKVRARKKERCAVKSTLHESIQSNEARLERVRQ
ncbi:hypothetical protein KY285_023469 [Solanum tuberosum]|nr:hypothetical protein KY289_023802 [Solanum tuberosum]KAH0675668.1 hypothetical protein KY285_023469 [Solanum tuberosum]